MVPSTTYLYRSTRLTGMVLDEAIALPIKVTTALHARLRNRECHFVCCFQASSLRLHPKKQISRKTVRGKIPPPFFNTLRLGLWLVCALSRERVPYRWVG